MKTTTLIIIETDPETATNVCQSAAREIARVDIPPVAEPLKLLVRLLQTVDDQGKPKRTRSDKGKPRTKLEAVA